VSGPDPPVSRAGRSGAPLPEKRGSDSPLPQLYRPWKPAFRQKSPASSCRFLPPDCPAVPRISPCLQSRTDYRERPGSYIPSRRKVPVQIQIPETTTHFPESVPVGASLRKQIGRAHV